MSRLSPSHFVALFISLRSFLVYVVVLCRIFFCYFVSLCRVGFYTLVAASAMWVGCYVL